MWTNEIILQANNISLLTFSTKNGKARKKKKRFFVRFIFSKGGEILAIILPSMPWQAPIRHWMGGRLNRLHDWRSLEITYAKQTKLPQNVLTYLCSIFLPLNYNDTNYYFCLSLFFPKVPCSRICLLPKSVQGIFQKLQPTENLCQDLPPQG